jgi:hypothetical protein
MRRKKQLRAALLVVVSFAAVLAPHGLAAQQVDVPLDYDGPVPVRVRHFDGAVTVQRASAGETTAALVNLPLDAGDRLWTEARGRVEMMLSDGTLVWLDERTTVDIASLGSERSGTASILRLWSGSLIVQRTGASGEFRVDSGDGVVSVADRTLARIDVDEARRLWLSVYSGEARMAAGGIVETLGAGRQTYAEPGTAPAESGPFNTADADTFATWQQSRWLAMASTERHVRDRDYLPAEVRPYAAELETSGSWFYHDDFGAYAWRPSVSISWSPYNDGRWVYSYGGWSWVSGASWGWATAHYGRWHHLPARGWVWFPGAVYRPAWVSWYVGGGYVGWCPIGYYNRPFISIGVWFGGGWGYGHGYHGGWGYRYPGQAYPRGKAVAGRGYARGAQATPGGWTVVSAGDLGQRDAVRRAVARDAVPASATRSARALSGTLRQRDLTALGAGAAVPTRTAPGRSVGVRSTAPGSGVRSATSRPGVRSTAPGSGVRSATPRPGVRSTSPGSGVRSATPRPGVRSTSPGSGVRSATPRPGVRSTVPRSGTGPAAPRGGVTTQRPRPGGLSSGLPARTPPPRAVERPSTTRSRPAWGSRTAPGTAPRAGTLPRPTPRGPSGPRISVPRGSSGPRISAPRGSSGPRISAPRGSSGPRISAPRGSSGPRISAPRGSSVPRGASRSGSARSRGGSRGRPR